MFERWKNWSGGRSTCRNTNSSESLIFCNYYWDSTWKEAKTQSQVKKKTRLRIQKGGCDWFWMAAWPPGRPPRPSGLLALHPLRLWSILFIPRKFSPRRLNPSPSVVPSDFALLPVPTHSPAVLFTLTHRSPCTCFAIVSISFLSILSIQLTARFMLRTYVHTPALNRHDLSLSSRSTPSAHSPLSSPIPVPC